METFDTDKRGHSQGWAQRAMPISTLEVPILLQIWGYFITEEYQHSNFDIF